MRSQKHLMPSGRRERARWAVGEKDLSIRLACEAFGLSQSGYREVLQRNVKGFDWNHKRVHRIHREVELNLRIKPRRRMVRVKP